MVKLKNIRRNERTIEADFYPEDSKEAGHILIDVQSKEVLERTYPKEYEGRFSYATHAKRALLELAEKEELPETYTVMWY